MTAKLGMITFDTLDARPLARWWADQTGGAVVQDFDGWFVIVQIDEGAPLLAFQKVEDPTPGKNRVHLDLVAADLDAEVIRLIDAGATKIADREMPGMRWITLADPDGNQFCVSDEQA